ncbi:MAG: hypothetical protein HY755_09750 [Nitrospirae bacterium]|nr:hypothetical protein [Nitrospirota bacterium]
MAIPEWLKKQSSVVSHQLSVKKTKERFLDKTLQQIVSFTEDTMFNDMVSSKNGFFQKIEPRTKIFTILIFIVILSLQKGINSIAIFLVVSLALALFSRIPLYLFIKRLLPVFIFTLFISMPATLNIIVNGKPLIKICALKDQYSIGRLIIPQEIFITHEGVLSVLSLLIRVTASVSFVFLMTFTTPPNRFIKAASYFMPAALSLIVSISYRYIFFLIRKVEEFIMGFKSRNISPVFYKNTRAGQGWAASRMSLLFSISLKLSKELEQAMESRGYTNERFKVQDSKFKVSGYDRIWILFSIIFSGVMLWKF